MPDKCPESTPATWSGRRKTVNVTLYIVDRQQVWLDTLNVDWAVRYLYSQNLLKGVPLVDGDDAGPSSPASTAQGSSEGSLDSQ